MVGDAGSWAQRYADVRGHFEAFTLVLRQLLEHVMNEAAISVAQVEDRTKTVASFADKLARKNDKYVDPLDDVTDLSALRVVVHYPADVERVGALIEHEFEVDWRNSIRRGFPNLEPDRFGYQSDHYVVRISEARCQFVEWRRFAGYRAEIQVRTVMQHAWAAVDHKVQYKGPDLPPAMQRRLSRLSALLEVADEQFASIQAHSDRLQASYAESVGRGELSIEINALSLDAYLSGTNLAEEWGTRAVRAGFEPAPRYSAYSEDALPRLLRALDATGIGSVSGLANVLHAAEAWGDGALSQIAKEARATFADARHPDLTAVPICILEILVLVSARDDAVIEASNFSPAMKRVIQRVSHQRVLIINFGPGATVLDGEDYRLALRGTPVAAGERLSSEDVANVQLRLFEVRPGFIAKGINRTIELEAVLLRRSEAPDDVAAELADDNLRWRAGGPEAINIAYDVTSAAKHHMLGGEPLLRLRTTEAIEWTRVSVAIFGKRPIDRA